MGTFLRALNSVKAEFRFRSIYDQRNFSWRLYQQLTNPTAYCE